MIVLRQVRVMQKKADLLHRERKTIGLVPTMGALHEGHLSLVRLARRKTDYVVVSVFVNPLQFGPKEDLARYPRNFARDRKLLRRAGADCVYYPPKRAMYPPGHSTFVEVRDLTEGLCGRSRPGHFRGVTTVVAKLLNIVKPDFAVFGAKDFQQTRVIQKMARELDFDTKIVVGPTVREPDGLAMSSRNAYLTPAQRMSARVLSRALRRAEERVRAGFQNAAALIGELRSMIESEPETRVDYIELVDPQSLKPVDEVSHTTLLALAVFVGPTRLIDNALLTPKSKT